MAFRFNVLAMFLLFTVTFVLSAKNSGKSNKHKPGSVKLSENISKNPFLQSTASPLMLSENINNNLFLHNRTMTVTANGGNPFFSHTTKPTLSLSNSDSDKNQTSSINNTVSGAVTDGNIAFNKHNPFLQAAFNADNNLVHIGFSNSSSIVATGSNKEVSFLDKIRDKTASHTNTKTKSELMCEEYERQISSTTEILSLVGTTSQVIKVTSQTCINENRLVVGGTIAVPGEFPHMVALGTRTTEGTFQLLCGGTLISPKWVLTAAHCTYEPHPTDARVGFHNLGDNSQGIITTINDIIRHPNYKPPAMYADIGLVKLNTVVTFNKKIRPACLYQQYDTIPLKGWVSGWGLTEFGGEEISNQLQKAELDIIDNLRCVMRHGNSTQIPYGITPSMICAGDPRGGWNKDTCQGDSGGPLQIIASKNSCLFQIIGITSFGQGCASIDIPGVYTRVSHYLNWIEDIVWP